MTDYHRQMFPIILDIDMLRCFLAVAENGSFTKAGEEIGLTQSGTSVKIRRLEDRLDTAVFQRTSKSLSLTPAGEILKGYALRILDIHDEAVRRLSGTNASGNLRVGMADYFVPNILPALLSRFRQHYPSIHLEITAGLGINLLPLFDQGKLDLVVAGMNEGRNADRSLIHDPLMWMIGRGHSLNQNRPVPLAMLPDPCGFRKIAIEMLEKSNIAWEIVFTGTSVASVQAAVQAGLGISILPAGALGHGLQQLPPHYGFPALPVHVLALFADNEAVNPAKNVFIDYLQIEISKKSFSITGIRGR